jgi:hypothetical protein
MQDTPDDTDCQGPTLHGLGMIDLIDTDSPVSDADMRWALLAIATIDAAGPSMAADLRAALADGIKAQWWAERRMTAEQIERVDELAATLVYAFDVQQARAQKIAKEKVVGTRRTAVIATIRQYLALVEAEAEQRREREQPAPITITSPSDVPAAVALAQGRRHHG